MSHKKILARMKSNLQKLDAFDKGWNRAFTDLAKKMSVLNGGRIGSFDSPQPKKLAIHDSLSLSLEYSPN